VVHEFEGCPCQRETGVWREGGEGGFGEKHKAGQGTQESAPAPVRFLFQQGKQRIVAFLDSFAILGCCRVDEKDFQG
jgi:hypothetical protein